jgi:hypothetical protein
MAIAHVQTAPVDVNTGVSSGAATFGSNVTAGNMIVVVISLYRSSGGSPSVTSITDTLGNTYAPVIEDIMVVDALAYAGIWRAFNILGGANTVTVNVAGTNDLTFTITEASGALTTDPNDASNSAEGNSQAPSVSLTTVDGDPGVFGGFIYLGTTRSMTAGSGYATLAEDENGSSNMPLHSEFQAFASSGAKTVDGALGTAVADWLMVAASFKAAGGAPRRWLLVQP